MPFVELPASLLAPGVTPVRVHYREVGAGRPIVILHGGWGYEIYPFDRQIAALAPDHRLVIPDRTGYGASGRLERQEVDFHQRAAAETFAVIAALDLERPVLWGHSDGAVIALLMAIAAPERLGGVIAEATHFFRSKPASREFFDTMMASPDLLGDRVAAVLAREHGEGWRDLIRTNGIAWRRIADERAAPNDDLYGGRLAAPRVPTLLVHGARDPRTEPGELDALRAALGRKRVGSASRVGPARFEILAEGGHSPHSERATSDEVTRLAAAFVRGHLPDSLDTPDPPDPPDPPAPPDQS